MMRAHTDNWDVTRRGDRCTLQKVDVLGFALCCLHDDKLLRGNTCHLSISLKHLLASNGLTWITVA